MWYLLARASETILQPSEFLLGFLCVATIAILARPSRHSAVALACAVAIVACCAWSPFGSWLMRPLEGRFPKASLPKSVTGIVVLGGAFDVGKSASHGTIALNSRAERMTAFVTLARRYPKALLIFSGGKANTSGSDPSEAQLARQLFVGLGLENRVRYEGLSRNTRENAVFSERLARPAPEDTWILVTSAADMPRAVGCFRKVGWNVVPYPVDYHSSYSWWSTPGIVEGLAQLDWATHEWLGLVFYDFQGWTPTLFPAPVPQKMNLSMRDSGLLTLLISKI
jgi:uncharacterized SAM-binding protein YcdF (DUF218 family)